jgi:hypothetical protein
MCSARGIQVSPWMGCPIRTSSDHRLPAAPRGISLPGHVLLRPQMPRHPPCALRANPPAVHQFTRTSTAQRFTPRPVMHTNTHPLTLHVPPLIAPPRLQPLSMPVTRHPLRARNHDTPQANATSQMRVPYIFFLRVLRAPSVVKVTGGAAGTRTPDLRLAKAALSRLSYSPVVIAAGGRSWT